MREVRLHTHCIRASLEGLKQAKSLEPQIGRLLSPYWDKLEALTEEIANIPIAQASSELAAQATRYYSLESTATADGTWPHYRAPVDLVLGLADQARAAVHYHNTNPGLVSALTLAGGGLRGFFACAGYEVADFGLFTPTMLAQNAHFKADLEQIPVRQPLIFPDLHGLVGRYYLSALQQGRTSIIWNIYSYGISNGKMPVRKMTINPTTARELVVV